MMQTGRATKTGNPLGLAALATCCLLFAALCVHSYYVYVGYVPPLFAMEMTKNAPESWALKQVAAGFVFLCAVWFAKRYVSKRWALMAGALLGLFVLGFAQTSGNGILTARAAEPSAKSKKPNERSFWHMPGEKDFRSQEVAKGPNETAWPFAEANGVITCSWVTGQRQVLWFPASSRGCDCDGDGEVDDGSAPDPAPVLYLSVNPFELVFLNITHRELFLPTKDIPELIARVAPYYTMGMRLCDQPLGTHLDVNEL
jgi:hypothetical protein